MRPIPVTRTLSTPQGYQFIPIGDPDRLFGQGGMLDQAMDRVFRRKKSPVEDFWATLGRQDGQPLQWNGFIECSRNGNDNSTGVTADEVSLLKDLHPEINPNARAIEKVISFDNVSFDGPDSQKIRLTVMVDPGEGAIVYYQHTDKTDATSQQGVVEYIHPSNTPNYDDNQRDRLDYYFEVPALGPDDRFVVKAVTFPRDANERPGALLRKVENPYRLLRYNKDVNDTTNNYIGSFEVIAQPNADGTISGSLPASARKLKTLLLVHGTFSTTNNSYGGLLTSGWLKDVIENGPYEQVLAIDHPTVFEGPAQNMEMLKALLGAGPRFDSDVHIITTSRGGLVGKTIVNDKTIHDSFFSVERVAAQACANGVEYFSAGWKIAKGLAALKEIFRLTGREGLSIFTAIAETSAEFFLSQPGCVAMTPGSAPLEQILSGMPVNPKMRYFPVTGNYIPESALQRVENLLIKIIYQGDPNDWVVGTKQQAIMPDGYYAYKQTKGWDYNYYLTNTFSSIHTKYLVMQTPPEGQLLHEIPRQRILNYLRDSYNNIL